MKYRKFFDDIEKIVLKDELSKFTGVNDDGIIEFSYIDLVKTAGHSCLTVGGAYLIALEGLKALFPGEIPKRGQIKVEINKAPGEDNAGVVGCVLSNITGATTDYGFGGLGGKMFNRRNLLFYNASIETFVKLTRLDTRKQIGVNYSPGKLVNAKEIFAAAVGPNATEEGKKAFPDRFQDLVEKVLNNAGDVIDIIKYD